MKENIIPEINEYGEIEYFLYKTQEGKRVKFNLRGSLTTIEGVSGTYKSYLLETLHDNYEKNQEEWGKKNLPPCYLINSKNTTFKDTEKEIKERIEETEDNALILIDNGDTILGHRKGIIQLINNDKTRTYVIVCKNSKHLKITTNHISLVEEQGDKLENYFLTSVKGWYV